MIKHGPVVIEYGDGDIGSFINTTPDGIGYLGLFNTDPGKIGRLSPEPEEGSIGAYIAFKKVESLDVVIGALQELRDLMVKEATDEQPNIS